MIDKIVAAILDTPDAEGVTLRKVVDVLGDGVSPEPMMKIVARAVLTALREPDDALIERAAFAAYASYAVHITEADEEEGDYGPRAARADWKSNRLRTYPQAEDFRAAASAAWAAALTEEPK